MKFIFYIINLSALITSEFVLLGVVDCLHVKLQITFLSETLNSIHKVEIKLTNCSLIYKIWIIILCRIPT